MADELSLPLDDDAPFLPEDDDPITLISDDELPEAPRGGGLEQHVQPVPTATPVPTAAPVPTAKPIPAAPQIEPPAIEDEEPLSLIDESEVGTQEVRVPGIKKKEEKETFTRELHRTAEGATRCKIFNSKISVPALEAMERNVNKWLDNTDIDIKQVGHMVGTLRGKSDEDNVILVMWY